MIRTLAIIAGAGFLTFIVCLTSVIAMGGPEIVRDGFVIPAVLERIEQGDDYVSPDTPRTSKTFAWTGTDELTVDLAADVTLVEGETAGVTVTGLQRDVDQVRVEGGRIFWEDHGRRERHIVWHDDRSLKIVVTAPKVSKVTINGSGDVTLKDYSQPSLAVSIAGSGDLDGRGATEKLTVDIAGSGDVDLRYLTAKTATLDVAGSGDINADATDEAVIKVSGSGDITLSRTPTKLSQDVAGSGDVYVGGRKVTPEEEN
ncbi:DUF2807 domain-containing protein [Caulobacter sp. NIBR1757]|uniref:GIN domain-containing protein n=1 Tax=Caulobacter sp. NIBR1757 TaxID=3016000 RepID=UPI0022F09B9E|nr:DUF2807 domain-containing protein [Caulobacter sp. NIBR1757]WGM37915.1 hypothetical protein AMEJIAPC_00816 [Caulobacter sp. NIBR1757]